MTDKERKLALYCLKASSDYHSEVCEECINYPNCDHTWQDDVTETIIKALEQEPKAKKVIKMRDATPEEQEAIDKYIKSISKPTGVNFGALEQEPKWIPVSEKLPEDNQEVQITYKINVKRHVWSAIWDELHGRFYDKEYRSYISLDYVTAWQPLPKPYKGE